MSASLVGSEMCIRDSVIAVSGVSLKVRLRLPLPTSPGPQGVWPSSHKCNLPAASTAHCPSFQLQQLLAVADCGAPLHPCCLVCDRDGNHV
eukprot:8536662-Alexandrium_andersonii.AAC.1